MLGLGWSEMLVIGVVALIVIGPRDLPVVMSRVGKIFGQIRRMGNEFQREINRSTGLSEVRNLRDSITSPLKQTADEIRKEFNAMTPNGAKPTGVLKPTDPKVESVVDDIKAKAGMTTPPPAPPASADEVAKAAGFKPAAPAPTEPKTPLAPKAPVKAARTATKALAKAKAVPDSTVVSSDLPPVATAPEAQPAKPKPAAKAKAAASAATKAPTGKAPTGKAAASRRATAATAAPKDETAKPAPRKRAPAKPKPAAAEADKAGDN